MTTLSDARQEAHKIALNAYAKVIGEQFDLTGDRLLYFQGRAKHRLEDLYLELLKDASEAERWRRPISA